MSKGKKQRLSPVSLEGARSASGSDTGAAAGDARWSAVLVERWSANRKKDVVLRLLRGESLDAVSREVGVELYRLEQWRDQALAGMDAGLRERGGDPLARQLDAAKRHIGELVMQVEILKMARELPSRPLPGRRSSR